MDLRAEVTHDVRVAIRDRLLRGLAGQLGHPRGLAGRGIGSMLNRGNRAAVTAAVDELAPVPGEVAADIGFGGGLGLALLLDRVGDDGRVHGLDISRTMLSRARRSHRRPVATGRLVLHEASMTKLPLADSSVDAAMSNNTLYFVPDESFAAVFTEVARVLSPTGRVVLGIGDPDTMTAMPVTAHGFRIRPVDEVLAALTTAGLTLTNHRRVGSDDAAFHLLVASAGSASPA